jgi:hypothetical protein
MEGPLRRAFCFHGSAYLMAAAERVKRAYGHYSLGTGLLDAGRPDEALPHLRKARELDPQRPQIHNNLGIALQDAGRLDEAKRSFRAAIALDPRFADAYANLHSLLVAEDPGAAIGCLERAIACGRDNLELRFFLGVLLEHAGEPRGAELLQQVATGGPLDRARVDAWRYIHASAAGARMVATRAETFRIALEAARVNGLVLEFGVHFGASIRQIAALAGQAVHGFDSFQGLPEDWHHEPRGSYSTDGALPEVPPNVTLHAGWFAATLPGFLERHAGALRLGHVDCDLYSSTKSVLDALAERVRAGTVFVFDEYAGNEHWRDDEFRAFQEAVQLRGWCYEYLCYSLYTKQAAVRIASPRRDRRSINSTMMTPCRVRPPAGTSTKVPFADANALRSHERTPFGYAGRDTECRHGRCHSCPGDRISGWAATEDPGRR